MLRPYIVHILVVLFLIMFNDTFGYCRSIFIWEDTNYKSDTRANFCRSKYHLIQLFGDTSLHQTNFFEKNYNGSISWIEYRLLFPYFSEFIDTSIPLPDPFFNSVLKGLKDIDWEDRWDYGIGIEWRPFKKVKFPDNPFLQFPGHSRFYIVYLKTVFLQYKEGWDWRPDDDFRIGVELYRECNLYNEIKYWGEFWADGSWRKTNFYLKDYNSFTFAFVPKLGGKLFPNKELAIMPYFSGEIAITERTEFWQNRLLAGFGIRVMPFRWRKGAMGIIVKGSKFYIENLWVINYFKNNEDLNTPNSDFRAGITFTVNRW